MERIGGDYVWQIQECGGIGVMKRLASIYLVMNLQRQSGFWAVWRVYGGDLERINLFSSKNLKQSSKT